MTRRVRPAQVRFYIDADLLGLAKVLAQLRSDVTFPGDPGAELKGKVRPACVIRSADELDTSWIPKVAREGWVIVTRDRAIQDRIAELAAVREHGAKMVALAGADSVDRWHQLEVFMCHWRRLDELPLEQAPFVYNLTRTRLRPIPLS